MNKFLHDATGMMTTLNDPEPGEGEGGHGEEMVLPLYEGLIILAVLATIGFLFELGHHKLHGYVTNHQHGLVRYDDNIWNLCFQSYQAEVTVLGFIAFIAYLSEVVGIYAAIVGHDLALEEEFRASVERIHMILFATMLLHVCTLCLAAYHADKVVTELEHFRDNIPYENFFDGSSTRFPRFKQMKESIEGYLKHTNNDFANVSVVNYLVIKIKYDLRRMIEFSSVTWAAVVIISATIGLVGYFYGGAENMQSTYQTVLTTIFALAIGLALIICIYFYNKYRHGIPLVYEVDEVEISNFRLENVMIRVMQVFQFYVNLKWVFLLYGTAGPNTGDVIVQTIVFIIYLAVIPRVMVRC
jgi:hypothetical protein